MPTEDYTRESWAAALLQALGMPVTAANVRAIVAWEQAEGGHWSNVDQFNPLNTTQPMPGARSTNAHGVKAYTSWSQGLQATVKTLTNGMYGSVLAALRKGDDPAAVHRAVIASPWGTKRIGAVTGGAPAGPDPAPAAGGAMPAATVPIGWHIPGTPWDIPTPGDAIGGIEGAAAGIGRALTRAAIMLPIVAVGALVIALGLARTTRTGPGRVAGTSPIPRTT